MRLDRIRRAGCMGVTAALLALSAGCGGGTSGAPQRGQLEKTTLKVGVLPITSAAPLFIAQERGFFAAEGLKVQVQTFQGGQFAFPSLKSGATDIALSNAISVFLAHAQGQNLNVVSESDISKLPFTITAGRNSKVRKPADLRGKKVAINARKNIAELACLVAFRVHNIDPKTIRFVVKPFPEMPKALASGEVDAAWLLDPFLLVAEQQGARKILDTMTGPTQSFAGTWWVGQADFVKKNPNSAAAFKRAIVRAQLLAEENQQLTKETIAKTLKIPRNLMLATDSPTQYVGTTNPTRLQRVSDLMVQFGYLKKRILAKEILANLPE
jgi:NitT/TauT family transport system substrate-binding protein